MTDKPLFYTKQSDGILLKVKVKPAAKKTAIMGTFGEYLKISVQSPAVEGAANKALIQFLAKIMKLKQKDIIIRHGELTSFKLIHLPRLSHIIEMLEQLTRKS